MSDKKIKGKKWIIILSVLVLIAIIVTLVVVFLPKNVDKIISEVDSQSKTMLLKEAESDDLYLKFKTKITGASSINEKYGQDTENVYDACKTINEVVDFYNGYLVFAFDNSTFQGQYSSIMKNYSIANSQQRKMEGLMEKVTTDLGNRDSTFFENAWKEFKGYFVDYFNSHVVVINSLCKIYENCIPKGIIANEMTELVLGTVNDYLDVIKNDFDNSKYKLEYLDNFLGYLDLDENKALSSFNFSQKLQENIEVLGTFGFVYGEDKSLKTLIEGITADGFTMESNVVDTKGVLDIAKNFLTGGLEA